MIGPGPANTPHHPLNTTFPADPRPAEPALGSHTFDRATPTAPHFSGWEHRQTPSPARQGRSASRPPERWRHPAWRHSEPTLPHPLYPTPPRGRTEGWPHSIAVGDRTHNQLSSPISRPARPPPGRPAGRRAGLHARRDGDHDRARAPTAPPGSAKSQHRRNAGRHYLWGRGRRASNAAPAPR